MRITARFSLAAALVGVLVASVLTASPAYASSAPRTGVPVLVENQNSHMCMDVAFGSRDDNARIQQYICYGGLPEQWRFNYLATLHGVNYFEIVNVFSNKCLDVPNGNASPGVQMIQFGCWQGPMQLWGVVLVPGTINLYTIAPFLNQGLCLDDQDWNTTPGANIQLWPCNGLTVQRWVIQELS
jgi:hypothetical protein